jgi:hypothetical protein
MGAEPFIHAWAATLPAGQVPHQAPSVGADKPGPDVHCQAGELYCSLTCQGELTCKLVRASALSHDVEKDGHLIPAQLHSLKNQLVSMLLPILDL